VLQVLPGQEKKYIQALEKTVGALPAVDDERQPIDRQGMVAYVPERNGYELSHKTFKWGKRKKQYGDGGWVFVQAVMDNSMFEMITKTYFFQGWHFKASFKDDEVKAGHCATCQHMHVQSLVPLRVHAGHM
jgi:hypothetical protein